MSTVLTINGSSVSIPATVLLGRLTAYRVGGYPSLSFFARGGALPGNPDDYAGKAVSLSVGGTDYFVGDCTHGPDVSYDNTYGWIRAYQCMGLRNRMDWLPHTDENTGTETTGFNLQPEDPDYLGARAGRDVGQIITAVLQMPTNANALDAYGIGGYTGLPTTPVLDSTTVSDLAALTVIPPAPVYVSGEKLGAAVEGFLATWAPNIFFHVQPDGVMRFLDLRSFTPATLTIGTDPIDPPDLARSVADCFQRVVIRGAPWVEAMLLTTLAGDLTEDFAWGAYTNAQAKTNWLATDFTAPSVNIDHGTCTCPTTLTITVTSANAALTWASDFWDQTGTGRHGVVYLRYSTGGGTITQFVSRRIVANTSLSAGGTSTLTVDIPLPITSYDTYNIIGTASDAANVWRLYAIANSAIAAKLTRQFNYPQPFRLAADNAVMLTSAPIGSVVGSGGVEVTLGFISDPTTGTILFNQPTYIVAGNAAPVNVRALVAVNSAANTAIYPPDSGGPVYNGTSNTVEGLTKTLTLTIAGWRDPVNNANMVTYASDVLDSVKNTIVEGPVHYFGLYTAGLTPGVALNVTGSTFSTGWDSLDIAVRQCDLEWPDAEATTYRTTLHLSNRLSALTSAAFLRPDRTGFLLPAYNPFGVAPADTTGATRTSAGEPAP